MSNTLQPNTGEIAVRYQPSGSNEVWATHILNEEQIKMPAKFISETMFKPLMKQIQDTLKKEKQQ